MITAPLSRNDPCPCGSDRRYKHCHGAPNAAAADSATASGAVAIHDGPLLRARLALGAGDTAAAALICRAALALSPTDTALWNLLGEALRTTALDEAEDAWRRVLEIDPANPEARFHIGNVLRERGDAEAAAVEYRRALESAPGNVGLLNNLGLALEMTGEREQAERCFRDVLAVNPQQSDALGNLASTLFDREAFAESVASYDMLFSIRRDLPTAIWVRRAIAQQKVGALPAAEASFREAARQAPDDARIRINLGTLLTEQGNYADAEPQWLRALELTPSDPYALSMLAHVKQRRCAWDGIDAIFAGINRLLENDSIASSGNINPFTVLSMPVSPQAQLRAAARWAAGFAPKPPVPRPIVELAPGERLRVGFVSSDFRGEHPVARVSVEMFERLDRARVETFAYSLLPRDTSVSGQRIATAFEHFADVAGEPTRAIAQRIKNDRIAVLFDLNGYTTHDRSRIFALRPAPIQINWLGYPSTLGAPWIDYVLTDRFATPMEAQVHFSERFLYLAHSLFPGDARREVAAVAPSRSESGLPANGFVFCCFTNPYKILPPVFDVWMRLLAQVPDSVVWLSSASEDVAANLRREAAMRSVDPSRLVFAPRVALPEHLARHCHADLFLDTLPYNAHTTANDALWIGVPMVTCAGSTMAGRLGGSQLNALGLPELVTTSLPDYEALALRLARRPEELSALRARLAANRPTQPLFDMTSYARDFADCLSRAWRDHADEATSA